MNSRTTSWIGDHLFTYFTSLSTKKICLGRFFGDQLLSDGKIEIKSKNCDDFHVFRVQVVLSQGADLPCSNLGQKPPFVSPGLLLLDFFMNAQIVVTCISWGQEARSISVCHIHWTLILNCYSMITAPTLICARWFSNAERKVFPQKYRDDTHTCAEVAVHFSAEQPRLSTYTPQNGWADGNQNYSNLCN